MAFLSRVFKNLQWYGMTIGKSYLRLSDFYILRTKFGNYVRLTPNGDETYYTFFTAVIRSSGESGRTSHREIAAGTSSFC